jgi:hypothetical protein
MSIYGYTYSGFKLIDFNSDNWHDDEWYNWTLLDSMFQASFGDVALPIVGGTANAITLNYTPDRVLANGLTVVFIPTASPTGATTISVDGNPPKPLLILGNPVVAGDFLAGEPVKAIYDGAVFNTVAPLKKFSKINIIAGPVGGIPNPIADDLTISHNENAGITVLTPNNLNATIAFADTDHSLAGYIQYQHVTDSIVFARDTLPTMVIDAVGLYMARGNYRLNLTGANNFQIAEHAPNVTRLGSDGTANGLLIDNITGAVTAMNGLTVVGPIVGGSIDISTATGILPIAHGGTGGHDPALARANLELKALSIKDNVNNADWSGTDLAVVNGGTGASDAATALTNLGGQPLDADLTAIAALATQAYGRSFLTLADAAAGLNLLTALGFVSASFGAGTLDVRIRLNATDTLMIQGGTGSLAGNTLSSVAFPVPYSVAPVCVICGGDNNINNEGDIHPYAVASTASIQIVNSTDSSGVYTWLAIGKL